MIRIRTSPLAASFGLFSFSVFLLSSAVATGLVGCAPGANDPAANQVVETEPEMNADYGIPGPAFRTVSRDDQKTGEATFEIDREEYVFTRSNGEKTTLSELADGKPIVVVVTRGATTPFCPGCTTQASRLIRGYQKFVDLGAEVVVVYPQLTDSTTTPTLDQFLKVVQMKVDDGDVDVPFPFVFDADLATVTKLGIAADLAKPSTLIFDSKLRLVFAFVGENPVDRPSIDSLLAIIREMSPAATEPVTLRDHTHASLQASARHDDGR